MAEITKASGLSLYLDDNIFKFSKVSKDAELEFEFPWKAPIDTIDYIDPGCYCTKAWFEDGKIKGVLSINKAVNVATKGEIAVHKIVTIMMDKSQSYFLPGPKLERTINNDKPFIRITLTGTALIE